jgi:DNA repair protein RecO (recombination protein O)
VPHVTDRALLLRRFPYGESSLVVQALTREHGRVHLIAKGAYRPSARYFAVLDLFDTLELEWSHQRGRELEPLAAARILERRSDLARDAESFRAALGALDLASAAAHESRSEASLLALVERAFELLRLRAVPARLVEVHFELAFLHQLGLAPALAHCAACGKPAPRRSEPMRVAGTRPGRSRSPFAALAGGRLCRACDAETRAAGRRSGTLPLDVLEFARELQEAADAEDPLPALERAAALCDAAGLARVQDFIARFLEVHLEARPKSLRAFLETENRNVASAAV